MSKDNNIVKSKYRFQGGFNIGIAIFIIIILYVSVNIVLYVTSDHISVYEVEQGSIASNNVYKGLALRSETIVTSSANGYINYYLKAGDKASVVDTVCSVDTDGSISNQISNLDNKLTQAQLADLSEEIDAYTSNYDESQFYEIYQLKDSLSSSLTQDVNLNAYLTLGQAIEQAAMNQTFVPQKPPVSGIVLYYTDGYEALTVDGFKSENFDVSSYQKNILNTNTSVNQGDPIYKLLTDETWHILVPISTSLAEELSMDDVMRIRFCSDDETAICTYTIIKSGNTYFLNLELTNSAVRYAKDRYINIELLLDNKSGLKVPNSSIVTKEFFTIPKELFALSNDSSDLSLTVLTTSDGQNEVNTITPTIYYATSDFYYVDMNEVKDGTRLLYPDSQKVYEVGEEKSSLTGVYNINKGYAVFKQINILYQNDEYSIVEMNTSYGIMAFDHIALDGSKVHENQLVLK